MTVLARVAAAAVLSGLASPLPRSGAAPEAAREPIEADWLKQAEALSRPAGLQGRSPVSTYADAAGAVDGVKDGNYAFHTAQETHPWWQVDLGTSQALARIVVYNRLDYAPGLHNADGVKVLTSDDGKKWTLRHDNRGKHFGGIRGAKPLEVRFEAGKVRARFVRLALRHEKPIFLHLDEVEVYGPGDAKKNLALRCPADQSSVSVWSTAKVPPRGKAKAPAAAYPTQRVLDRGRLLAADLRAAGVATGPYERELAEAASQWSALPKDAPAEAGKAAYLKARWAVRKLAFANPLLNFDKLLFIKRFTQETYPDVCLNHMPWVSRPGGDLCVLSPVRPDGTVRVLLKGALGPGHLHGMDLWWDGSRVVFGYAKQKSGQPPRGWRDRRSNYRLRRTEEPTHLFEVAVDPSVALGAGGERVRQLTRGEWSDLDPTYLPNGDIAFASERCGCSLQCNEYDKDETSCNLYVMKPDGKNIRRLTVTKDGDYLPHALDDGTIAYTRWEYQERSFAHIQSIWTVRPDGTFADALFKQHMNNPWALEDMRSIPRSRKLVAVATGHHTLAAGPVVVIDAHVGMNASQGISIVTPGVHPPEGGMTGLPVPTGGVADRGGFYMTPWPLSEKYFLVSYCYGGQTDRAGYALYLIDVFGTKELVYRDPEISCSIPIPLRARPRPPILPDLTDPNKDYATCALTHVSYGVEGVPANEIRYVRIAQRLAWPYCNKYGGQRYEPDAKGGRNWTPARVIGTVPVDPDGSAYFRVPVDTAVYFQLLDANHMELRRMRSFISFQPGESRGCTGCHETRAEVMASPQNPLAHRREPVRPTPPPWGTEAISFLRDVQPVFDRHCVRCHAGLKPPRGLDFSGGLTARHNRAYDTLRGRNLVSCSNVMDDAKVTPPLAFGSRKSKLVHVLRGKAHAKRAKLGEEDWLRLVTWIDLNAPYHDRFINKRPEKGPYDMPQDRELARKLATVHAKRCASCHKASDVSRLDWIDLRRPAESLFLSAPLAAKSGGKGKCKKVVGGIPVDAPVYESRSDPDYRSLLEMVGAAVERAWQQPRRDLRSLPRDVRPGAGR